MKLHLPNQLRAALLACMAVAASFSTTIATGTITGGALIATLAVSQQAMATDYTINTDTPEAERTWTLGQNSDTTHASDTVTVSGSDVVFTINRTNSSSRPTDISTEFNIGNVTVEQGATLKLGVLTGGQGDPANVLQYGSNLKLVGSVTLGDGATLKSEDSAFALHSDLNIQGTAELNLTGSKSYDFQSLVGGADAVVNILSPASTWAQDYNTLRFNGTEATYEGTINLTNENNSSKRVNIIGKQDTFAHATLNLGDNTRLLLGAEQTNVKSLNGTGFIELLPSSDNKYDTSVTPPVSAILNLSGTSSFAGTLGGNLTLNVKSGGSLSLSGVRVGETNHLSVESGATAQLTDVTFVSGVRVGETNHLSVESGATAQLTDVTFVLTGLSQGVELLGAGSYTLAGTVTLDVDFGTALQSYEEVEVDVVKAPQGTLTSSSATYVLSRLPVGYADCELSFVDGKVVASNFELRTLSFTTAGTLHTYSLGASVTFRDGKYIATYTKADGTESTAEWTPGADQKATIVGATGENGLPERGMVLEVDSGSYSSMAFSILGGSAPAGTCGAADDLQTFRATISGDASVDSFGAGNGLLFSWMEGTTGLHTYYGDVDVDIDTTGSVGGLRVTGECNNTAGSAVLNGDITVDVRKGTVNTVNSSGDGGGVSLAAGSRGTHVNGNITYTIGVEGQSEGPTINGLIIAGITDNGGAVGQVTGDAVINLYGGTYNGSIYATGTRAPLNGNYTVNYYGGQLGDNAQIGVTKGGTVTGTSTLNVAVALTSAQVDMAAFDALNILSTGSLAISGTHGFSALSPLDNNGVISFAEGTTFTFETDAFPCLSNVVDEEDGTVTSTYLAIDSSEQSGQYRGVEYLGAQYSVSDGKLLYQITGSINGWDANWGAPIVRVAPSVASLPTFSGGSIAGAQENVGGFTFYFLGKLASSQVNVDQPSTGAGATLIGGAKDANLGTAESPRDTWVYYDSDTNWKILVGGGASLTASAAFTHTGDSHILMASGEVEDIIGGNFRSTSDTTFNGNSYVSVEDGAQVRGFIVGAGTTGNGIGGTEEGAAGARSVFNGNTHVNIYSILSNSTSAWLDPTASDFTQDNAAVVGGAASGNGLGSITVNGNTNVFVDLRDTTYTEGTDFNKSIIGGSLTRDRCSVVQSGASSVVIHGVDSTGANVTFTKEVIGGTYAIATGRYPTVSTGDSSVQIAGGHYKAPVIAGSSVGYWITTNVSGCASLTVSDGVFDGIVIGAARIVGSASGSSTFSCVNPDKVAQMALEGGTFNGDVVGGIYTAESASDKTYKVNGDIVVTLGKGGTGPTLNGTLYGGSYVASGGVATYQKDVTINVNAGTNLEGSIYAAGKVSSKNGYVMSTQDTAVNIASGVSWGGTADSPIVISGGYKDENNTSTVASSTLGTIGEGEVNLSGDTITLQDFTVANVAEAGATLNIGSKLAGSGITQKTGAGTLIISGANATSLAVNAGTLQAGADTSLTGLTFADNTTLKLTSFDDAALSLGALTLEGRLNLDVTALTSASGQHTLATVTGDKPTDLSAIALTGAEDGQLDWQGNELVLTLASTAGDLYWIGGEGHNVWTPSDTDSFSDTAAGTAGSSPFSNGDNVTFATAATPTLEGNLIVGTLTANAAVSLNVGTTPASLTVDSLALGDSGSLAKTGEGTLTVSENLISSDTTAFALQGGTLVISDTLEGQKTYNISSAAGSTLSLAFSDNTANTLAFTSGNTLAGTTAITDGYVSMDRVSNLDIAAGATVNLKNYKASDNSYTDMSLTGSGTLRIDLNTTSNLSDNHITFVDPDADAGVAGWTGTVVLSNGGVNGGGYLFSGTSSFGNASSVIELKGLLGYPGSGGNSTIAIDSAVVLTNPDARGYAWRWSNAHDNVSVKFNNSVSGTGDISVELSDRNAGNNLVFVGDVSQYTGTIKMQPGGNNTVYAEGDSSNSVIKRNVIEFSGSATEVNASIEVDAKAGREVWLQFTNDQDVAMNGSIKDNVTDGNTGTLSLHKSGSGILTLTGENTYSGATYIEGGTLVANDTSLSQNTSLVLSDGTTFRFSNTGDTSYELDNSIATAEGASATIDLTEGAIEVASDALSGFAGTINMAGGVNLTLHTGLAATKALTGAGNVTIDSTDQEVYWDSAGKTYTGATAITDGTTVRAEGGLSSGNTAVTLGDGARLILADITDQGSTASANSGFGSINTGTSGTVVITTNDAFSAGKWIVGAGTIEVDIDLSTGTGSKGVEDIRLTAEGFVNNAIPNAGEATSAGLSRFSGTYLLTSGQLYLDGQRNGKLAQGVSPTPTVRIMEDGQLWVAERDGGNWTFNIDLAAASSEAIGSVTGQQAGLVLGINGTTEALFTGSLTLAAGTAISSTQGYSKFSGSAVINGDASIDIASGSAVTLAGDTDLNAHTLTKTGEGKLQLGSNSNITNWDTAGSTLDVQAGTLALHLAGSTGSATWNGTIRVADGAKVYRDQGTVTLSALEVADTGTVTLAARTNQTWNLASVEGGATIRLTRENAQGADYNATATNATLISLTGQNDNFTGTWDVASFITLQLADAAAAEQAAIHLTYASGTSKKAQLTVSSQEETYLIRELSGVTGTQVNAGKYNVAAGGTFSGTLASGVELTVSGGDMDLSGAALSAGNISIIGSSTDATISNLSLGSGVTLSSSLSTAETPAPTVGIRNLTLAGGTLKFAMNGTDEADTYVPVPRFDAGGTDLSVTSGTVTTLMLDPGPEAASIAQGTYTLISNIGSGTQLADLLDSVRLNYSNEGRTQYTLSLGENSLQLLVQGGSAATLTWQGGSADTWDTDQGNLCWDNSGADDCFYSYDNVIFGTQSGADGAPIASTVSIAESGVTAGTITVVGASDYTFQGGGISSATDSAGLTVGTADSPFTGTLRIETANSWLGDTTINSGTVVAADTAALSDTTATVNAGGALVVDLAGEADRLDAAVILKGGTLAAGDTAASTTVENLGITAEGATLDGTANTLNVALGSISEDASITTLGTVSLTATEAKTLAGLTVGVEGEGAQTSDLTITTGTSLTSDATVNTGSTLTVAGTLTAGNITGAGTLTVGETLEGSLTYSGQTLEVDTVVLNNATLTSTAEGGTTVSGAVTAGSRQGINKLAAFEGTWKLDNLQENAYIQVGTGSNELQQGHLTANRADGATIEVFGEGSSLTVTEKSAIQSVQANSGNEVTLADGTSVETLDLAATLTGTKAVLASDGTLTVNELGLIGTDASAVGTLIVTGDSSISTDSSAGAIVVDGQAASLALSASSIGDLTISQGVVTVGDAAATASSVTLNGTGATLDLSGGMLADTITMQAGSLANAGSYTGTVDVTGASGTLAMGGLTGDATLNLAVAGATLQLTELTGVTLGNSSVSLSDAMKGLADDAALLQLDAPASVAIASGATVTINVNDVLAGLLGTELNADTPSVSASYTIGNGNADLNTLDGSVTFDAALAVMNITADFTEDGQLVLTRYGAQSEDAVYVATEDQGDGVETWAGNGKPNTYDSTEGYVAIVIDQDTTISLKGHETPTDQQGIGLNLPNLIGANGSTLTVQGDNTSTSTERDLVTINPNISVDELPDNVGNSLSYNGHINLEQTDLQLAATDAATGGQTPDTVYAVNGKLTADADSQVILTSGVLQLNGTGNTLGGGLTVAENGGVQANGDTTLSGTVSGAPANGDTGRSDITVSGGKELTLAGASLEGVSIAGESGSQMTVAAGETASAIDTASGVAGMLLHIEEGAKLTIRTAADASMRMRAVTTPSTGVLEYTGLTGSGELASEVEAAATLTLDVAAGDSYTFEGSMTGYNGTIILKGAGTQGFASDAGGTTFSVQGGNLVLGSGVASVKNLSLSGSEGSTGSATINLAGSDTSTNRTLTVNDTLSLTTGGTLNLTLNLTKSMLSGTGAIQTTGSTYDGGTVAITFAGVQSDLDLTGGESVSAVIVQGTEEAEGSKVTLTDTGDKLLQKYFGDTAALQVTGGNLVLSGTTVDATTASFHQDAASSKNGHTGAVMLDALYSTLNPQVNDPDSAAAAVLDELEQMILAGNTGAADRQMAAVSGASATAMGAAFAGDMQRQLMAIRNRTTTMGVGDSVVSHDLPYFNAWVNAEGNYRTMEQDGTLAGYEINSWGATAGFDADLTPKFTAGLALTAMYGDLTAKAAEMAEGDLDTYYVTAFARYAPSAWVHTFVASVGIADASLERTVGTGSGAYRTSGDTNGIGIGLMYEVGYTIPMNEEGTTALQPIANITYAHSSLDGYTETGSDMAVRYGDQTMDMLTIGLGLRAQTTVGENVYNRTSLLEGRVLAKFDLGDRSSSASAGLVALGRSAGEVESAEIGAVGLELGAGLTIPVGQDSGSLFLDGSLELRADYTNVNATVGYRVNF